MPVSFAELSSLYSNAKKAPTPLNPGGELPGASVFDKLSKLHLSRRTSQLSPDPCKLAVVVPAKEQRTIAVCLIIVECLGWTFNISVREKEF